VLTTSLVGLGSCPGVASGLPPPTCTTAVYALRALPPCEAAEKIELIEHIERRAIAAHPPPKKTTPSLDSCTTRLRRRAALVQLLRAATQKSICIYITCPFFLSFLFLFSFAFASGLFRFHSSLLLCFLIIFSFCLFSPYYSLHFASTLQCRRGASVSVSVYFFSLASLPYYYSASLLI
jgi:hypothetical protein